MHSTSLIIWLTCFVSLIATPHAQGFSWPEWFTIDFTPPSWLPTVFSSREVEEKTYEYSVQETTAINLTLVRGSVRLETWNTPKVVITTTIKARTKEELVKTKITAENSKTKLIISIEQPDVSTTVDVIIMVPAHAHLSIKIVEAGPINGNTVPHHLSATTNKQDITLMSSVEGTIVARTEQGSITATCELFGSQSSLLFTAPRGSISLQLPATIQARIEARTQKGVITSTLPITLDPFTTTLDRTTWKRIQKLITGTIHDGEAPLILSARDAITLTAINS